jgi:hypothetical protein
MKADPIKNIIQIHLKVGEIVLYSETNLIFGSVKAVKIETEVINFIKSNEILKLS